jgi:hypothetical protein
MTRGNVAELAATAFAALLIVLLSVRAIGELSPNFGDGLVGQAAAVMG